MLRSVKGSMDCRSSLLQLPDAAILEVLRHLDARSLVMLEQTNSYFARKEPVSRLPLVESVAKESVHRRCGSQEQAERFRQRSWRERLYLEESTGVGFDRTFCEEGGFRFQFSRAGTAIRSVRLTGMGPKLLVSDLSTRQQGVLRWQLRVKGNTAVEFGVIPADLELSHTALHKCMSVPQCPQQRAMGFCSQITAGSLLPLKAPVMRGTVLDVVARRGHLEVVLAYPEDAKEISWHNGQPVQRPYYGPRQLRFEQDFPADYDVRLAVTSWAKAHFEVLHTGYTVDAEWAAASAAAPAEAAAGEATAAGAAGAAEVAPLLQELPAEAVAVADDLLDDNGLPLPPLPPPILLQQAGEPNFEQQQQQQAMEAAVPLGQQVLPPPVPAVLDIEDSADAAAFAVVLQAQHLHQMMAGAVQEVAQDAVVAAAAAAAGLHLQQEVQQLAGGLMAQPLALAAAAAVAGPAPGAEMPLAAIGTFAMLQQALVPPAAHQQPLAGPMAATAGPLAEAGDAASSFRHCAASSSVPSTAPPAAAAGGVDGEGEPLSPSTSASLHHSSSGELCQDGHLQQLSG